MTSISLPRLPQRIEEIDTGWLTSALRACGAQVDVRNVRIVDVNHGTCTKVRLALEYGAAVGTAALPRTMILKAPFEPHSERMPEIYRMEARFYEQIAPSIPLNVPRVFFAGTDPQSWHALTLMEDLVARGVTFCRAQAPFTYEHVARRLAMLAAMHARTWQSPDILESGRWCWLQSRFSGFAIAQYDYYLEAETWQHYVDSPRGAAVSTRLHDREQMRHALRRLGEIESLDPLCLIHGDTHPGNLYLDADGTPGFLDPLPARACWWLEVAYHLVASLDIADRRRWEQALLASYLNALERHGVAAPEFDQAWLRYRQSIVYGLYIFLINETRFQSEATNTAYTARFGTAAIDHDSFAALG